ncbi:MAG: flagellar basal body P-ring protein FlgI [Terriglobales bacterium]
MCAVVLVLAGAVFALAAVPTPATAPPASAEAKLLDIATLEGVRSNSLLGYGLVVGLDGTGDQRQTLFTIQTLANILKRMGVEFNAAQAQTYNTAAVFVTAQLPPFARPGTRIDVTVSSIGDAKSLEGGLLLLTPLMGPDGVTYADAQGAITLGGYLAGGGGNSVKVNQSDIGIVPNGGVVERGLAVQLGNLKDLNLLLRRPDFLTAVDAARAINAKLGRDAAVAVDSRCIRIHRGAQSVPDLMAEIEEVSVPVHTPATVVVDERTGTVVLGQNVTLGAVSILHGDLAIEISTRYQVSQPPPFSSGGKTIVVPQTQVQAQETPTRRISLAAGATVQELVRGLHAIGATSRDIVGILQALEAQGALHARLEVI